MNHLPIALLLFAMMSPAASAEQSDWHVLKTDGETYAYDANAVEPVGGAGAKSVSVYVSTSKGYTLVSYFIDCRTNHGEFAGSISSDESSIMTEGNADPRDSGWGPVAAVGTMKIAADIACLGHIAGSSRVGDRQVALDSLKTSN